MRPPLDTAPYAWTTEQLRAAAERLRERAYQLLHVARDLERVADGMPSTPALVTSNECEGIRELEDTS